KCSFAETAATRKVRCPRCQAVFAPTATPPDDAVQNVEPSPPPGPRASELIPPAKKRASGTELIPPPPDGPSVKRSSSFVEREIKGFVVIAIVGAITFVIMMGIIGLVVGWSFLKAPAGA